MAPRYLRWLLYSVLYDGKTTLWCANQIGADPDQILIDFEIALHNYDKLLPITKQKKP